MTNNICTSINQSKALIDLGLDASTADMFWDLLDGDEPEEKIPSSFPDRFDISSEEFVPSWSLQTMMNLLPSHIFTEEHGRREVYNLHIGYNGDTPNVQYVVSTHDTEWYPEGYRPVYYTPEKAKTWIDAVCCAMEWVLKNNYYKK